MDTPACSVWVQLYYEDQEQPDGRTIEITPVPEDVAKLAEVVKAKLPNALSHCDASDLYVYSPGTEPHFHLGEAIDADMKLEDLIAEYESKQTPPPTSSVHPLIVVAPPPQQQLAPPTKKQKVLYQFTIPPGSWKAAPVPFSNGPPPRPRNGVLRANVQLQRIDIIYKILERANPIAVIRSPPATGKTSLLDLTEMALTSSTFSGVKNRVIRLDLNGHENPMNLLIQKLGTADIWSLAIPNDSHLWILIDDGQLEFKEESESFWKVVIKDVEATGFRNIHVLIAATYDMSSQGMAPVSFGEYPHIQDLKLSSHEADTLYDGYISNIAFAKGWIGFKDTLLRLADGHVGVLSGGISMLLRIYGDSNKQLSEPEALDALRDYRFRVNLNRCFPRRALMTEDQRKAVRNTILDGPSKGCGINSEQGSIDDSALVDLVRAGILSSEGSFTCLVAQWHYFNQFYRRPTHGPATIEDLVVQAVESMSALRLQQSCDNGNFPKEAVFQHLFNEAFTMLLPPGVAVCSELNTFAKDSNGKTVTGELDFFIAGNLHWAIELLRNGNKINEHEQRFDPTNGKYRLVEHTAHLVVDCRGPRASKQVQSRPERCTLYFSTDFESVEIKMRETATYMKMLME